MYFQQDGAPSHYKGCGWDAFNNNLQQRWIDQGVPIAWPPRSPDLIPSVFFLWGYVKDILYSQKIRNVDHFKENINGAVSLAA